MPVQSFRHIEGFNTQPPEGGWLRIVKIGLLKAVSTHSRLKAAGSVISPVLRVVVVSTHSRLKAAGCRTMFAVRLWLRFQHTAA